MMYLCITLPFIVLAWIVYTSKNLLLCVGRWILRRRYQVECTGDFSFEPGKNYLVLPNHPIATAGRRRGPLRAHSRSVWQHVEQGRRQAASSVREDTGQGNLDMAVLDIQA